MLHGDMVPMARPTVNDEGSDMDDATSDGKLLTHIQELVAEEKRLMAQGVRSEDESARLRGLEVQLDQCWDLLRQRRAARETGHDPREAHLRPPETVEKYIG